ncbi:MAG TPA: hypothetical protein VLJ37_05665 [bacterium]|nr:hypothetical protein [bacterium]
MRPSHLGFLSLLLVSAPGALAAAPGDIDTTFGTNGFVTIDVNNQQSFPGGFAIQDDGKLVLAGAVGPGGARDFLLIRGTPDGAADPDFVSGGLVVTSIGPGEDLGRDVAVLPDGKILVAGMTDLNGNFDVAFVRYRADGTLDTTFGTGGIAVAPIPSLFVFPTKMALQPDGRIIVVGGSGSPPSIFVARYHEDGTLDSSFDGDGYAAIQPGGQLGIGNSVVIQGDGKIVVAGNSGPSGAQDLTVLRLNSDGSLDTGFDGDGVAIASFGSDASYAAGLALQPDGAIVATGALELSGGSEVVVVRFLPDGSLDPSFGTGGTVSTPVGSNGGSGAAAALQGDGKILVAGVVSKGILDADTILLRYLSGGALDPDFAGGGLVTADAGNNDHATSVALASDGKILVAGQNDHDLFLIRFENDAPPPPPAGSSGGCQLIAEH